MKIRDIIKLLEQDGWYLDRTRGSPTKAAVVTVPGKPGDDLATGTLNSILKTAGLKQ